MEIGLYDSVAALPEDDGNRILVFAGRGSLLRSDQTETVTEIHCTYRIGGGATVQFLRNGDAAALRFEQALSWAVEYAAWHGINTVYGVFELSRPLDFHYLNKICPDGITDRRKNRAAQPVRRPRGQPSRHAITPRHMVQRSRRVRARAEGRS